MSASTEKKLRAEARANGTDKKINAAQEAAQKAKKQKTKWTIIGVLVVLCIVAIIGLNIFFSSGYLYKNTTAVTIGDESFSPAEMNYFYAEQYYTFANNYGSYASLFGLDTSNGVAGLASQSCGMLENGTWKDYFLQAATSTLQQYVGLKQYADQNGITLSQEEIDSINSQIESLGTYASYYGYANVDGFLAAYYGNGVDSAVASKCMQLQALANAAYTAYYGSLEYTDAELEDYYQSLNGASDVFDYAYYYVKAETVTTGEGDAATTAATDETMAAAKATADQILAAYLAGEADEAVENLNTAVAASVADASATERSNASGSSIPTAMSEWMLAARRQAGDATVMENEGAGYYVVVFLSRSDNHYNTVNVRHILVKAVADENGAYTDEAKAEALSKAEDILARWKAGEKTEESFAALANELSEDTGSNTNGGLYENVYKGEMVANFESFCFDEGHKAGDTGIVYGESSGYAGYHVMYLSGEGELYSNVIARNALSNTAIDEWIASITPAEVTNGSAYSRIG